VRLPTFGIDVFHGQVAQQQLTERGPQVALDDALVVVAAALRRHAMFDPVIAQVPGSVTNQ
jgi:hypothetical protein